MKFHSDTNFVGTLAEVHRVIEERGWQPPDRPEGLAQVALWVLQATGTRTALRTRLLERDGPTLLELHDIFWGSR